MKTTKRILLPLLFFILLIIHSSWPAPLLAQARETNWRTIKYDIEVSLDPDREYLTEKAKIDVEATSDTHALTFALNEGFHVLDIRPAYGVVDYRKRGEALWISIDPPLRKKNTLFIELEGKVRNREPEGRSTFSEDSIMLLWSDLWYPVAEEGWAESRIQITLPERYQVVGPGKEISRKQRQGKAISLWQNNKSSFFSVMADTRWIIRQADRGAFKIKTYLYPEEANSFEDRIITSATDILNYYSEIFCPYPFPQLSFVELEGLEGSKALNSFVAYSPERLRKVYASEGYDAHETALQWWGNVLNGKGKGGWQWIEGFGHYAEYLYCEYADLPLTPFLKRSRIEYFFLDSKQEKRFSELDGSVSKALIQGKGPAIMEMLRYQVGDKRFFKALKLLFREKRFSSLTLEEFQETLEKGTGRKLQTFFDEWIYRSGAPRLSMDYKTRKTYKGEYRVDITIRQSNQAYSLPVEILMAGKRNRKVEKVEVKGSESSFFFTYDFEPKNIIFDPQNKIFRWEEKFRKEYERISLELKVTETIQKAAELEKSRDFKAAEELYESALKELFDCRELLYNYARMEQKSKDYYKAIELYEKAVKAEPLSEEERGPLLSWSHIRKGNIWDLLGERRKALKEYRRALKLPDRQNSRKTAERYIEEPYIEY